MANNMLVGLETGALFKAASSLQGGGSRCYWRVDGWWCCYGEEDGENIWVWILSAIEEFVSEENLRCGVVFCLAMKCDILGGEQWLEKKGGEDTSGDIAAQQDKKERKKNVAGGPIWSILKFDGPFWSSPTLRGFFR